MSVKSPDKAPRRPLKKIKHAVVGHKPEGGWKWIMLLALPLWVFVAFMASSYAVGALLGILEWLNVPVENYVRPAVLQTALAVIIYGLTIAVVLGVPYLVKRHETNLQMLGLTRLPSWTDIGLAPLTYIVYIIVLALVLGAISAWFPAFPLDEAQDVGFKVFGSRLDNLLAFFALVILAPIAEEVLFRGYLYGKLKTYVPAIVAAIATSLLFALVHFQWNVGVDVFIMSLFLCSLRSLTGSIWAGILVHMIKNGIAYYVLFVSPLIGG